MNEFWLWFIRPFAELLAAFAFIAVFVMAGVVYYGVQYAYVVIRNRIRGRR